MEKVMLQVKGMSCQHCVKSIESNVGKLSEVKKVKVYLSEGNVEVEFKSITGKLEDIKNCIEDLGYAVCH
ncbi:copper ion binding protein [Fredinandcohnia sp. 179-A 10B2 NHS]|uniref:copper ion binding protein n=1 Tax=Fredinandcohnia sp. 179-A 10B2 NHS TaxID=3235176 RepID=UPI0039A042A4